MTAPEDLLWAAARATAASAKDVARARQGLVARGVLAGSTPLLLHAAREATAAPRGVVLRRPAPARARAWQLAGLAAALAAVALAAVALAPALRPPAPPAPPAAVSLDLDAAGGAALQVGTGVRLTAAGQGRVAGTTAAPRVRWEAGTLDVDVTPGQGIDLTVATREALIRVVGTSFSVLRDARGTAVSVTRGAVHVRCFAGGERPLGPGDGLTCMPVTAAALLGRARSEADAGAPPADVLRTVEAGLALADPGAGVEGELRALQVQVLTGAGRDAEALAAAEAYLDAGHRLRAPAVRRIAADLALTIGGCARARPHLLALAAEAPSADAAARLATCTPGGTLPGP